MSTGFCGSEPDSIVSASELLTFDAPVPSMLFPDSISPARLHHGHGIHILVLSARVLRLETVSTVSC